MTIAPIVYFFSSISTILDADPIPPFMPMQIIPVPPPTAPSSNFSPAVSNALRTSASVRCMPRISFNSPSLHSVTTPFTVQVVTPISGFCSSIYRVSAFSAVPTPKVLVIRIGVSILPSSSIWIKPALLPNPLMTETAAGTFSLKRFSSCGKTAVTPVWICFPSSCKVTCPTFTPGTSVIKFRFPFSYLFFNSTLQDLGKPILSSLLFYFL